MANAVMFSMEKFPRGEGKSIISHNSQEMGGGEAVVGSSQAQSSSRWSKYRVRLCKHTGRIVNKR